MGGLAGITNNRSLLEKADLSLNDLLTDGGLLVAAQAAKFMQILIKQSKLMKLATVTPMASHKQLIEKTRFDTRVLRAGDEGVALPLADRSKPTLSKTELDAQLFKAEVRLSNEDLEDNIERDTLRQTIMSMLADAIARDMEEVALQGDTTSTDTFLAKFDGIIKQATSHTVDALNVPLNKTIMRDMLKALPSEYLRNKGEMTFLTSVDAELDYRDILADRASAVGDKFLEGDAPITYAGIPIVDLQLMPENLGVGNDTTDVIFTDPRNVTYGIWRNIRIETDKLVREGVLIIVATLRFDVKYAHEDAVVKAVNVNVA